MCSSHYTSLLMMVIAMLLIHATICREAEISFTFGIIASLILSVLFFFNCSCIAVFLIIYFSTIENFLAWNEMLQKERDFAKFATLGLDYVKALKFFKGHASGLLFHFCTGNCITGIAIVYRTYSFGSCKLNILL